MIIKGPSDHPFNQIRFISLLIKKQSIKQILDELFSTAYNLFTLKIGSLSNLKALNKLSSHERTTNPLQKRK
jgi:hypothetical protein